MSATESDVYHEHYLGARDVCQNCLRLIRVERVDPMRGGLTQELDSHYARRRKVTSVEYGPADAASDSKGVFCQCGVESARHRVWDDDDIDRGRFRDLVKHALRAADAKDITLSQKTAAALALQRRKDGASVDDALAAGIEAGIASAVVGD